MTNKENPIEFSGVDTPAISSLRERLKKYPPLNLSTHKLEDLTAKKFSDNNHCTIDQAETIITLYKQFSECPIPLKICDAILRNPEDTVPALIGRLTILAKKSERITVINSQ